MLLIIFIGLFSITFEVLLVHKFILNALNLKGGSQFHTKMNQRKCICKFKICKRPDVNMLIFIILFLSCTGDYKFIHLLMKMKKCRNNKIC